MNNKQYNDKTPTPNGVGETNSQATNVGESRTNKSSITHESTFDKGIFLSYLITSILAFICAFFIAYSNGIFENLSKKRMFAVLSDAFFAPGGIFFCLGVLIKISAGGFFDSISFILKRVVNSLIPGARIRKEDNYMQYKEEKEKNRKRVKNSSMLIVGLVFVLISALFLALYSNA